MKVNDNEPTVLLNDSEAHVYMSVCLSVCPMVGQWPVARQRDTLLTFTLEHCDGRLMDGEQG